KARWTRIVPTPAARTPMMKKQSWTRSSRISMNGGSPTGTPRRKRKEKCFSPSSDSITTCAAQVSERDIAEFIQTPLPETCNFDVPALVPVRNDQRREVIGHSVTDQQPAP